MSHNFPRTANPKYAGPLILASASPRRRWLLEQSGVRFIVVPAPEDVEAGEVRDVEAAIEAARAKAMAVAQSHPTGLVIGADTIVVADGQTIGKPATAEQAKEMLRWLSGRVHEVYTAVAIAGGAGQQVRVLAEGIQLTRVAMRPLSDKEIDRYVASGEPMDKAGAYAIQGEARRFIHWLDGPWDNVVGLPVSLTLQLIDKAAKAFAEEEGNGETEVAD